MGKPIVETNAFTSEEEAAAIAEREGFPHTIALDLPAEENDYHWHDFDALIFMVNGDLTVTYKDSGETVTFRPGMLVRAKGGGLHKEKTDGYRAVFGLQQDPSTLTQPINKPPVE